MKKIIICSLIVVSCLLVTVAVMLLNKPREPRHAGRALSHWLAELDTRSHPARRQAATAAVHEIGTNALPTLISILKLDGSSMADKLQSVMKFQTMVDYVSPAERRWLAINGFRVLGAAGWPAIPELTVLLNQNSTCIGAMFSLVAIGPEAVPALRTALTNENEFVRFNAAWGLTKLGERV
jgi:HEAT repeat protein